MAQEYGSVWAINIGNNSLKALHLRVVGDVVEVIGFDNIQHGKILNGSGIKPQEREELIALSLRQFVKQNDIGKDEIIVSVPSENSFARFVKLPPVEQKRIPEIVKFEAAQQIPFDINDVQWDWQLISKANSPEIKVGIFAIKSEVVNSVLEHFSSENLTVGCVQMVPMALYNYALYDQADAIKSENYATVIIDIGAENSDLVVCTPSTVWQRCIPMGGNAFTRAIADTFKLNFEKAEKLKRTAAMSKYARQVFQAMKPVFTDLASEIQRSLGFYNSSNPNTKLGKVIALGGGTKMRGLLKYLRQTLQIPVERPDAFKRLAISPDVSAAKFHENVSDFGIVYGLALQGLGLGRIESNLLPRSIARSMAWASKTKYFTAAASLILLVSIMSFARINLDRISYSNNSGVRQKIKNVVNAAGQADNRLGAESSKEDESKLIIEEKFKLFEYRDVIPMLYQTIISVLPNAENNPEQKELYEAFANGDVETVLETPRKERKQIFITSMLVDYAVDVASAGFGGIDLGRTGGQQKEKVIWTGGIGEGMAPTSSQGKFQKRKSTGTQDTGQTGGGAGFVVTITGYSPYKDIRQLMEPVGAENDYTKWGLITRLMHLGEAPEEFVFSVPSDLQSDLSDGKIPEEVLQKYEEYGISLSQNAVVSVLEPDNKWLITDGSDKYCVRISGDRLYICPYRDVPFELYEKTKVEHFNLDVKPIDPEKELPVGIGIQEAEYVNGNYQQIIKDPMTKEVISMVPDVDENGRERIDRTGSVIYRDNDYWFRLDIKFVWKDAPEKPEK